MQSSGEQRLSFCMEFYRERQPHYLIAANALIMFHLNSIIFYNNAFSSVELSRLLATPPIERVQTPTPASSLYKPPHAPMNSTPLTTTTPSAKVARQSFNQVAADFNTDINVGLSNHDVAYRRKIHGYNEFETAEKDSLLLKFWKSFVENPLILLLLGSALVSLIMGQMDDAFSITLVSGAEPSLSF